MRHFLATVALVVIPAASHGQSISFEGATLSYEHVNNQTFEFYLDNLEGSAEIGFGPAFSVQGDLAQWRYDGDSIESYNSYGLHLIYDVAPDTAVGGFYTREDWSGFVYTMIGFEARHTFGANGAMPLEVEAFYGRYNEEDDNFYSLDAFSVDADLKIASGFSLNGGVTFTNNDEEGTQARIGAEYALEQGPRIGLTYSSQNLDSGYQDVLGLTLAFDLKGGTTFKQRKWVDVFPGN
ncbi:MAG: hypothetical protein B7Z31_04970 [Rhodobacterales bacterium 12-65-15]|nr:MAG: hypothetical protein B7Z31_04970 [Rhodobacterales bacterium 12-65-15]